MCCDNGRLESARWSRRFAVGAWLCLLAACVILWLERVVLPFEHPAWRLVAPLRVAARRLPLRLHVTGLGDLVAGARGPRVVASLDPAALVAGRLALARLELRSLRLALDEGHLDASARVTLARLVVAARHRVARLALSGEIDGCPARGDRPLPYRVDLTGSATGWSGRLVLEGIVEAETSLEDLFRPVLECRFPGPPEAGDGSRAHLRWRLDGAGPWTLVATGPTGRISLAGTAPRLPLTSRYVLDPSDDAVPSLTGTVAVTALAPPRFVVDGQTREATPRRFRVRLSRRDGSWNVEDGWILADGGLLRGAGRLSPRGPSSLALAVRNLAVDEIRRRRPDAVPALLEAGRISGRLVLRGDLGARRLDRIRFDGSVHEGRLADGSLFDGTISASGAPGDWHAARVDVTSPRLPAPLRLRDLRLRGRRLEGRLLVAGLLPPALEGRAFPEGRVTFVAAGVADGRWTLALRDEGARDAEDLLRASLHLPAPGRPLDVEGRLSWPLRRLPPTGPSVRLPSDGRLHVAFRGHLPRSGADLSLRLSPLRLDVLGHDLSAPSPLDVEVKGDALRLLPCRIDLDGRPTRLSLAWSPEHGLGGHLAFHGLSLPLPRHPSLAAWSDHGAASGWARIRGALDAPVLDMGLSLCAAGRDGATPPLLLSGTLRLDETGLSLRDGHLAHRGERVALSIRAPGRFSLRPPRLALARRDVSVHLRADDLKLAVAAPHLFADSSGMSGLATADVEFSPFARPIAARGRLQLRDVEARLPRVAAAVKHGALDLRLLGDAARVESCRLDVDRLELRIHGDLRHDDAGGAAYDLRLHARSKQLQVADVALEGLDGEGRLAGDGKGAVLSGKIRAADVLITPPPSLQYHRDRLLRARDRFMPFSTLRLDVELASARPIRVRSRWVNAEFAGGLHVTGGREDLELLGELTLVRGAAHVQSRRFAIDSGSVRFTRTPPKDGPAVLDESFTLIPTPLDGKTRNWPLPLPLVQLRGQTRVASRSINFLARGCPGVPQSFGVRFDAPGSDWTSTEILSLLTVGRATTELANGELGRLVALPYSQALTETLLNNRVGHWLTRSLALDEIRLSPGQDLTDPVPHVSLGKRLGDLFLSADGSQGGETFFKNLRADWQLSPRLEASFSRSLDGSSDGELARSLDVAPLREDQALLRYTMRF